MTHTETFEAQNDTISHLLGVIDSYDNALANVLEVLTEVGDPQRDAEIHEARLQGQAVRRGLEVANADRMVTPLHKFEGYEVWENEG